ncbi:hypothetical protein HOD20_09400 [archaeon]|jgi:hypothetical protein|nr:hypothetical protein [archaeon]MBT4352726.1 hypothetical protein [archaeon]MBT4647099.1 hypothetical protein [archaeon]MBT6822482.1 hypothetical protein [archaeon]MBT7391330.1 hypothetical protein [archaeon]
MKKTKNKPEIKFRAGAISATVWNNHTQKDGENKEYKTISFVRNYQDKDGNWNTTNSLRINDLPRAELVLNKAYEYLTLKDSDNVILEEVVA